MSNEWFRKRCRLFATHIPSPALNSKVYKNVVLLKTVTLSVKVLVQIAYLSLSRMFYFPIPTHLHWVAMTWTNVFLILHYDKFHFSHFHKFFLVFVCRYFVKISWITELLTVSIWLYSGFWWFKHRYHNNSISKITTYLRKIFEKTNLSFI